MSDTPIATRLRELASEWTPFHLTTKDCEECGCPRVADCAEYRDVSSRLRVIAAEVETLAKELRNLNPAHYPTTTLIWADRLAKPGGTE